MFGSLSEGAGEIEDVFDSGWLGVVVVNGWSLREPIWCLDVKMEAVALRMLGDGRVEPTVGVIGCENATLRVIPPFLKQGKRLI